MDLNPPQVLEHLEKLIARLGEKNVEYRKLGVITAEKERAFRTIRSVECLKHRNKGTPVTLIKTVVDGLPEVSLACYEFQCATAVQNACLESLRSLREAIGAHRSFLTWMRAEMHESGGVRF
jgi:hypothetical protein